MNKFFIWGLVITAVIVVLIYRKRIFQAVSPTLSDLKDAIASGDAGMSGAAPAGAQSFVPSPGEVISKMLSDSMKKTDARALEDQTTDWASVDSGFTNDFLDNNDIISRPTTVNDLFSQNTMNAGKVTDNGRASQVDIASIIRNQVVINDLWGRRGHRDDCQCGCQVGAVFSFFSN